MPLSLSTSVLLLPATSHFQLWTLVSTSCSYCLLPGYFLLAFCTPNFPPSIYTSCIFLLAASDFLRLFYFFPSTCFTLPICIYLPLSTFYCVAHYITFYLPSFNIQIAPFSTFTSYLPPASLATFYLSPTARLPLCYVLLTTFYLLLRTFSTSYYLPFCRLLPTHYTFLTIS